MNLPAIALSEERIAEAAERRRRRTFRRTVAVFVSCVVLLVAVRVWWGFESGRRLRNEIARIRDAGEPLLVDDFNPASDIPDDENAAILYEQASAAFVEPMGAGQGTCMNAVQDLDHCITTAEVNSSLYRRRPSSVVSNHQGAGRVAPRRNNRL